MYFIPLFIVFCNNSLPPSVVFLRKSNCYCFASLASFAKTQLPVNGKKCQQQLNFKAKSVRDALNDGKCEVTANYTDEWVLEN